MLGKLFFKVISYIYLLLPQKRNILFSLLHKNQK